MAQNEVFETEWNEFEDLHQRLRANIQSMAIVKKKLLSKRKDDIKSGKKEMDRLYDDTCKIFTYLKSLHQKSLVRREAAQCELNALCKNEDSQALDCKNFEYDQMDTLKQIAICNNYKSHPNEPKLVPKKEFYEKNTHKKIDDIHMEKTLRLQYELTQRKELQNDLRDMTQEVKTHSSELAEKQRFLGNLQSKIGSVFEAIKPLQKYMNLPSSMLYPNEAEIDSLPAPLFAIYQSLMTQIHCDETLNAQITLRIIKRSDPKSTKSVLGKRKSMDEDSPSGSDNNKLEDGEIGSPPRKKARTSSSKSNRSKSSSKSRKKIGKAKTEEKVPLPLPESVDKRIDRMTLSVEFGAIGIQLEFMYCARYKIVLVAVKREGNDGDIRWKYEDASLFMNLFDGHSMIELPGVLKKQESVCAFSWVQELSGCYIFGAKTNTTRQREIVNLGSLQRALKERKEHRISLQNQIKQLMQLQAMVIESTPMNKIVSFKHKAKNKYEMVLERKPFTLRCAIQISASYPDDAPLFYVEDISACDKPCDSEYFVNEAKNIEIKLNGEFEYVNEKNKHLLLSMMIHKLQTYFDVYVDAQALPSNKNQNTRTHRGRDRRQQY
eukprot:12602_1